MLALFIWAILVLSAQSSCSSGSTIVSIQLKWLQQTQFAGYFAAQELGFYADECLIVNIRPGGPAIIIEDEVLEGRANFGIHWSAMTLAALDQNKNITIVAQIFQRIGTTLVSWKSSNINKIADFAGKKVCAWLGGNEGNLRATFVENGLSWDSNYYKNQTNPPNNPVDIISQGFSMESLISRECDVAHATTYNEYAQLLISEKSPGVLVSPNDLNVMNFSKAMMEDSIIASNEWLSVPGNQDVTVRFLRASFRGWIWARDNPAATVKLFADKGPLQTWQMNEVNRLIWPAPLGIGIVDMDKLQESADIAAAFNLTSRQWNVTEFYRTDLAFLAQQGLEGPELRGDGFEALSLSFCRNSHDDAEICDSSKESADSIVVASSSNGVVIVVVTLLGLIFTVVCLVMLVLWREERVIKSASLPFSLLMCAGAILGLISNFFLLERPTSGLCHARAWFFGVGFVMFIGNFLVKVWRIHVIFSAKVLMKIKIPDSRLHIYFSVLLAIQVTLLSAYSAVGNPQVTRVPHLKDYTVYDTLCVSESADTWNLLFTLYCGVLLLYGVYLAVQVRNLVSLFNEAKLLGGSIYNMIFVAVVCGPILLFLDMPPTAAALIRSLASFAMFTGSLAIVFLPKFCIVASKNGPESGSQSRNGQESVHLSSIVIDMESLRAQETSLLVAQKEKAIALTRAIDAEIERRARAANLNTGAFVSVSKLST